MTEDEKIEAAMVALSENMENAGRALKKEAEQLGLLPVAAGFFLAHQKEDGSYALATVCNDSATMARALIPFVMEFAAERIVHFDVPLDGGPGRPIH